MNKQLERELAKARANLEKLDARRAVLAQDREKLEASLGAARHELAEAHAAGSGDTKKLHERIRLQTEDLEGAASALQLLDRRRTVFVHQERQAVLAMASARSAEASQAYYRAREVAERQIEKLAKEELPKLLEAVHDKAAVAHSAWVALAEAKRQAGDPQPSNPPDFRRHFSYDVGKIVEFLDAFAKGLTPGAQAAHAARNEEVMRESTIRMQREQQQQDNRDRVAAEKLIEEEGDLKEIQRTNGKPTAMREAMWRIDQRRQAETKAAWDAQAGKLVADLVGWLPGNLKWDAQDQALRRAEKRKLVGGRS